MVSKTAVKKQAVKTAARKPIARKPCQQGQDVAPMDVFSTEKVVHTMMKNLESMTSMHKNMFDACVACNTTWTKGCEDISKMWMQSCQSMTQQWMQTCKTMMTAKTVKEAMDTQGEFMRTQFDTTMAETTKITELCVKLASEATEPVQSQWSQMVSSFNKAA
jgi:phasin family protein